MLHSNNLTPHRAIWTLAAISAVIGCIAVAMLFGDASAPTDATIKALPQGIWSSFGYTTHDGMAAMPNSLLTVTLASNFGTFLLYGLSCVICFVAYHKHPKFSVIRHLLVPIFGWSRCWRSGSPPCGRSTAASTSYVPASKPAALHW
jgi:hypothetical protein